MAERVSFFVSSSNDQGRTISSMQPHILGDFSLATFSFVRRNTMPERG